MRIDELTQFDLTEDDLALLKEAHDQDEWTTHESVEAFFEHVDRVVNNQNL